MYPITFRPHHFLCALCFQGKGYSPEFVANFAELMELLNSPRGEQTPIEIVAHTDSICQPCPHRGDKSCETEAKITVLDTAHADVLNIHAGQTLTWQQAKERLASHMTLEKFHQSCATCSWKPYGICEKALEDFLKS